jgi:adenine-specific DNA-methyltransferase
LNAHLKWLTRDDDIRATQRVPYRLLEEAPALSAGDPATGNMLIQGDNLDALKALLPFFAGRGNCNYIDPQFTTWSAFERHHDDRAAERDGGKILVMAYSGLSMNERRCV